MNARTRHFQIALILTFLLAMPTIASAASFGCEWFPFLPWCGDTRSCGAELIEVTDFGLNPGDLTMCTYMPNNLEASRPLVVALHGCAQQASNYDDETGWIKFADKNQFALLLPQQELPNNPSRCFNWFKQEDQQRGGGEALSIKQMIDKMQDQAGSDSTQVYITGLSGGGGMTAVMLATYPELFAGGAILAGIPYKCATNQSEALKNCGVSLSGSTAPIKDLSPDAWGNLVPSAPNFPRISIWQGSSDTTVNPDNLQELVDQWTNVLGIDQIPDVENTINGHEHKLYNDGNGHSLVETVLIDDMGHGTPIDVGNGDEHCGIAAPYILDVGACSSYYIVNFWGLDSL